MTVKPPLVDTRTASEVAKQVRTLLKAYAPDYKGLGLDTEGLAQPDPLGAAFIGIFARMAELTIARLNRVPEKNFLAFLDLLGASRLPPEPARVPLTFLLAAGSRVPGVVRAGTQAAAPPAEGEKAPTVFETEQELVVTPASLTAVFTKDPEADAYADHSLIASQPSPYGAAVFRGNRPLEHILYVGLMDFAGFDGITVLQLKFAVAAAATEARLTTWERWDGNDWATVPAVAVSDTTEGLRKTGAVTLTGLPPVPLGAVDGRPSRWLRCRLLTPINATTHVRAGMVRVDEIPSVDKVKTSVAVLRTGLPIDGAFTNQSVVDVSKDFFPFGEVPRFGDTFWLRADEAFSKANAVVTLHVELRQPATNATADLQLDWEMWNGQEWALIGTSTPTSSSPQSFTDSTAAFTKDAPATGVQLQCPVGVSVTTVNGVEGFWLRVRIVAGNYGTDAHYTKVGDKLEFQLADLGPPVVKSIKVDYELHKGGAPDAVLTYDDFRFAPAIGSFKPFNGMSEERPTAYLGFELPAGLIVFPNRPVSVFVRAADLRYGEPTVPLSPLRSRRSGPPGTVVTHPFAVTNPTLETTSVTLGIRGTTFAVSPPASLTTLPPGERRDFEVSVTVPPAAVSDSRDDGVLTATFSSDPGFVHEAAFVTVAAEEPVSDTPVELAWEYWNGRGWAPLLVRDSADRFGQSGTVEFLAPPDFAPNPDFGLVRYWIRVQWKAGDYIFEPLLQRLLLNTTTASQAITVPNEVLGTSDGAENQSFRATRAPVLPGQRLEVHEPELPPAAERAVLEREEGTDAVGKDLWVRWHEVPDFYGSGPRDRHYVVERLTGEVRLGNGQNGLIPRVGSGLRLARYRTGGGSGGNRPADTVVQLKTTVPYVDKVTNHEAATGGADAEPLESVLERAPRSLRHGGRAVTVEDYEDMAFLATPEVARAKCVPLANLAEDPLAKDPSVPGNPALPGEVSVIVVPRSLEEKPLPSRELLRRVQEALDRIHVPTARLSVVGPLYVRVDIEAVVAVTSLDRATDVLAEVQRKAAAFLHPLTGGFDSKGWDFGRRPHESDVYALIEGVRGVDHVRSLHVVETEDLAGAVATGRFLVYAGPPHVSVVLENT